MERATSVWTVMLLSGACVCMYPVVHALSSLFCVARLGPLAPRLPARCWRRVHRLSWANVAACVVVGRARSNGAVLQCTVVVPMCTAEACTAEAGRDNAQRSDNRILIIDAEVQVRRVRLP